MKMFYLLAVKLKERLLNWSNLFPKHGVGYRQALGTKET